MGNKSSHPFPPLDQLSKRFPLQELLKLEADYPQRRGHAPPALQRDQFIQRYGEGLGPATRRVLGRLFKILETNLSGGLEHEGMVRAAFFLTKANLAEQSRVLFSMYESQPSSGHLTKTEMAVFIAETSFAVAERPSSVGSPSSSKRNEQQQQQQGSSTYRALVQIDPNVAPFKDLTNVMVDVAFARHDADRDGKFSLAEYQHFAQHPDSGVSDLLDLLTSTAQNKFWG